MQFTNFGDGSDGVLAITDNTTETPIDASCSGTAGSTSLSATNASFSAGQLILIHQTRGTGVGAWELNQIASYEEGAITTTTALANTYTDSGASQAQVRVVPQYSQVTIAAGKTYTAKAWGGNVGGILAFVCNGKTTITGTITATGKGYRGYAVGGFDDPGRQGEGTAGAGNTESSSANGSGGGGGVASGARGAGGGGHAEAGGSPAGGGTGGASSGTANLTTMTFGGAGGSSEDTSSGGSPGQGGNGGGIVLIFSKELVVTGAITSNGTGGGTPGSGSHGGAGGGAGGSVFVKGVKVTLGSNLVTATGGSGGSGVGSGTTGGAGSVGRIRTETCSLSGTSSPSASSATGGHSFCGAGGLFYY